MATDKILIIHTFGIGDMIMFTPALELLFKHFPTAQFDFLIGYPPVADVVRGYPQTGAILFWEGGIRAIKQIMALRKQKYDIVLMTSGHNGFKSGLFTKLLNAGCTIGDYDGAICLYDQGARREGHTHRVVANLRIVGQVTPGIDCETPRAPRLMKKQFDVESDPLVRDMVSPNSILVGIHCGCRKAQAYKRWPTEHYLHLLAKIKQTYGDTCFLLFAGANEDQEAQIIHRQLADCSRVILDKPLPVVAAIIRHCRLMIANDSGLGHLSAAVGTPTLSIFGPSDPRTYAPIGEHCRYIKANLCPPCHAISVPQRCRDTAECLLAVQPDDVFRLVADMISLPRQDEAMRC